MPKGWTEQVASSDALDLVYVEVGGRQPVLDEAVGFKRHRCEELESQLSLFLHCWRLESLFTDGRHFNLSQSGWDGDFDDQVYLIHHIFGVWARSDSLEDAEVLIRLDWVPKADDLDLYLGTSWHLLRKGISYLQMILYKGTFESTSGLLDASKHKVLASYGGKVSLRQSRGALVPLLLHL